MPRQNIEVYRHSWDFRLFARISKHGFCTVYAVQPQRVCQKGVCRTHFPIYRFHHIAHIDALTHRQSAAETVQSSYGRHPASESIIRVTCECIHSPTDSIERNNNCHIIAERLSSPVRFSIASDLFIFFSCFVSLVFHSTFFRFRENCVRSWYRLRGEIPLPLALPMTLVCSTCLISAVVADDDAYLSRCSNFFLYSVSYRLALWVRSCLLFLEWPSKRINGK